MSDLTDGLDKQLDNVITQLDNFYKFLENSETKIQNKINGYIQESNAQEKIDKEFEELGENITEKLNTIRAKIIAILKPIYKKANEQIEPFEQLMGMSVSLDTVVDVVKLLIFIVVKPYEPLIELIKWFTTSLPVKLEKISDELVKISNFKPNITVSNNLKIPDLKIEVEPITIDDILN